MIESHPRRLFAHSRILHAHARSVWVVGLSAILLAGCTYSSAQQTCQQPAQMASAAVRVMVQFRSTVAGDSPEVLGQLQGYSRGCVTYVSSVSPKVHVYAVSGGGDAQTLRASLLQWSAVQEVVADTKAAPGKAK